MLATLAARTMSPHDASLSSAAAAVFAAEPGPGIQVDHGGPWWTMVDHGGLAMYGATTLPVIEASLKVSRSPSSASRATECDRACSLSFQTLVRTRSQQWFLESLRRFYRDLQYFITIIVCWWVHKHAKLVMGEFCCLATETRCWGAKSGDPLDEELQVAACARWPRWN